MPERDAWMGIDVGTQSVRSLVVDAAGTVLGSGSAPLTGTRDGDRHEQSPKAWWDAVAIACRAATSTLDPARISGVAVDATSGTVLLADDAGTPLTAGLMYDDRRAQEQLAEVDAAGAAVWARLGYRRMQAPWALPKLAWLLRNEPAARSPRTRLLHQSDAVTRALVGGPVPTDSSNALKTGYDLVAERWPDEVMAALGVPESLLPEVVRPGTVIGAVCPAAAERTGLPEGARVVAGMTDGCAAQLGAGAFATGDVNSVLGTTLVLKGVSETLPTDPLGVVYSHRSPTGGWLPGGASSTGGWALNAAFPDRDLAALDRAAAQRGPSDVVAYPLAARGERFPFAAPDAEGFLLGTPADEVDHYAAVLQGVAYVERLCLDHLDLIGVPVDGRLTFTGGGARSAHWSQVRADVLGRTAEVPGNAEPALGMAVLAAFADGADPGAAAAMVRVRAAFDPAASGREPLLDGYRRFVAELARRGWLEPAVAAHAEQRSST